MQNPSLEHTNIAIVGLGYVGLPLAVEFGKHFTTVGFDIHAARVDELRAGADHTRETSAEELAAASHLHFSTDIGDLAGCNVFVVTVPTPVDEANRPDLSPLENASASIGTVLKRGDIVIYESTVYPGTTEEICVPVLEQRLRAALQSRTSSAATARSASTPATSCTGCPRSPRSPPARRPRSPTSSMRCTGASSPPARTRPPASGWPRRPR